MSIIIWILLSVLIVSLISLIGVFTLSIKETVLKKWLFLAVGLSTGALIGDAFLHMIPEAMADGFKMSLSLALIFGILTFFIFEKYINWHNCRHEEERHCDVDSKKDKKEGIKSFGYTNLLGDSIHNFIDGMIIAGSFLVSKELGVATTLAVILHEIPQEIGDFGVLLHAGFSKGKAILFNFLSALISFLGVALALLLKHYVFEIDSLLVSFAAGSFIYIAGSDLIPELHKDIELKNSILQIISVLVGVALMYLLLFFD